MLAMRKRERVLGPYHEQEADGRERFRIIEIDAAGKRSSSLFDTERKAERYKELLEAQLESTDHTTETAFAAYKSHLQANGDKPESIVVVEWAVDLFFPSPVPLSLLTEKRMQALYDHVRTTPSKTTKQPLANDTHRGALNRIKGFFKWCCATPRNWMKESPVEAIKGIGRLRPRGKSLGKSGAELRVKQAREWYLKAVEMAADKDEGAVAALTALVLGMRAGEIVSRVVADLDEDQAPGDLLWIPCSKTPAGKRTLEVPDVLQPFLLEQAFGKSPDRPLFELRRGVPRANGWVRRQVHRVCRAAKVPTVTAHAMRGLLATLTSERGMAGHLIAATLGHTSYENMTRKAYAAPGSHETGVNRKGLVMLQGGRK